MVYAVKQLDCYLRFSQFTAIVDHAALQWLLNLKQPSGRLARWISLLQAYSFTVQYRPGRVHNDADGLSRRAYQNDTDSHTQEGSAGIEPHEDHVTALQIFPDLDHGHLPDHENSSVIDTETPICINPIIT